MEYKPNKFGYEVVDQDALSIAERLGLSEDRIAILQYRIKKAAKAYVFDNGNKKNGITEALSDIISACDSVNEIAYATYHFSVGLGKVEAQLDSIRTEGIGAITDAIKNMLSKKDDSSGAILVKKDDFDKIGGENGIRQIIETIKKGQDDTNPKLN